MVLYRTVALQGDEIMNVNEAIRYLQTSTFDDATEPVFVLRGRDRLAASCILY